MLRRPLIGRGWGRTTTSSATTTSASSIWSRWSRWFILAVFSLAAFKFFCSCCYKLVSAFQSDTCKAILSPSNSTLAHICKHLQVLNWRFIFRGTFRGIRRCHRHHRHRSVPTDGDFFHSSFPTDEDFPGLDQAGWDRLSLVRKDQFCTRDYFVHKRIDCSRQFRRLDLD